MYPTVTYIAGLKSLEVVKRSNTLLPSTVTIREEISLLSVATEERVNFLGTWMTRLFTNHRNWANVTFQSSPLPPRVLRSDKQFGPIFPIRPIYMSLVRSSWNTIPFAHFRPKPAEFSEFQNYFSKRFSAAEIRSAISSHVSTLMVKKTAIFVFFFVEFMSTNC